MTNETVKLSKAQLYKSAKTIQAAIAKAVTKGNEVQNEYQKIACSAILHLAQHKDIRVIRNLLETMPESLRRDSMAAFFDKYAPVTFDDEGQVHYDKDGKTSLGEALENAWWKALKRQDYKPFVFVDELEKLYNKANKRFPKLDKDKGDQLTAAQLRALKELIDDAKKGPRVQTIERVTRDKNAA